MEVQHAALQLAEAVDVVKKMKCELEFKGISYGSKLFCKTCGMDIGLNPIKVHHKDVIQLFCCRDCARIEKSW